MCQNHTSWYKLSIRQGWVCRGYNIRLLSFSGRLLSSCSVEYFTSVAIMSLDLSGHGLPTMNPPSSLTHMGNRRFCHVVASNAPHPEFPGSEDMEQCNVSLTVFDAFKDAYPAGKNTLRGQTPSLCEFCHQGLPCLQLHPSHLDSSWGGSSSTFICFLAGL